MYHRAFGLHIKSNLPIPGLPPAPAPDPIDIDLSLGVPLASLVDGAAAVDELYSSPERADSGLPLYLLGKLQCGEYYRLTYHDGTDFVFDRSGTKLWANWREPMTLEDTATYLLGPIFGFILRLRGVTCLHASAVMVGHQAIALVGPPGAGKSTTAAGFARTGLPVLCDDVLALRDCGDKIFAEPGYPRLRLWPQAVTMLCGAPDALPRLTPTWEKRYLDLSTEPKRFHAQPAALAAIYFLDDRLDCVTAPRIEALSKRDGLMRSIVNTYSNIPIDGSMRAREFEVLGRLINRVPVRKVHAHKDPDKLSNFCQVILDDVHQWTPAGGAVSAGLELGHV